MSVLWGASDVEAVFWGDLSLLGDYVDGGRFTITTLEGWEDLPDPREGWEPRPQGHGVFDAPVYAGERRVRIAGVCHDKAQRDGLLHELKRHFVFPSNPKDGLRDLTVTLAGQTLTVQARLTRFKPTIVAGQWGVGRFGWAAEFVAPDPLRYGEELAQSTGLPSSSGGLRFDLFTSGVLDFGAIPVTGMVTLTNEGTADTWPVFEVSGNLPEGFAITHTGSGSRVEFGAAVPPSSPVTIDAGTGVVMLGGTSDRSGQLTRREWVPVPAGGSATFAFSSRTYDTAAVMTAKARAAFW